MGISFKIFDRQVKYYIKIEFDLIIIIMMLMKHILYGVPMCTSSTEHNVHIDKH